MNKIFFTIDSAADLPNGLLGKIGDAEVVPLHIILGEDSYLDGVDVFPADIVEYAQSTGTLPKTSSVSVGEYADVFARLTGQGFEVVHIALSSGVSSTYSNACTAAGEFEGVYVVDSLLLTSAMALLLIKANELREQGVSAAGIAQRLQELKTKVRLSFIINGLDYLHKGGRCTGVAAFGANLLGIKPAIEMRDGKMFVGKKYRGKYEDCQLSYVRDVLGAVPQPDKSVCILDYTGGVSERQEQLLL